MDFNLSEKTKEKRKQVQAFIKDHIEPMENDYYKELHALDNSYTNLPQLDDLKKKAESEGLWNLFLKEGEKEVSKSTEYAPLAECMGHSFLAPEVFNCNAPDTGNMELLLKYGNDEQKERWLTPLLRGKTRSAFGMTEPAVASSDATNMAATAILEGDEVVINGTKWWTSGAGHPNLDFIIFMGLSLPEAPRHGRHSMVIVPKGTPGLKIERMLSVFGYHDEPFGHGEVTFKDVRVPKSHIIGGIGRGFEMAQGRLGPGRIHHCMRLIGASERALSLLCQRSLSKVAFGKPLSHLGGNRERIANARINIEQARLLVYKAAWMIDTVGVKHAMSEVSQIKVVAPRLSQEITDFAIQIHGGGGVCQDFPLAAMFAGARALRLADGPDEVHLSLVARGELAKYQKESHEKGNR